MRVNAEIRAQSAVGVYPPTFSTAAGTRALGVGRVCVRRRGGSLCIPAPGGLHVHGSGCVLGLAQWLGAWRVPLWLLHMGCRQQTPVPARDRAGATHLAAPPWPQVLQGVPLAHIPASSRCSPPLALTGILRAGCRLTDTPSLLGLVCAMSLCPPHPSRSTSKGGEEPDGQRTIGHAQQPAARH